MSSLYSEMHDYTYCMNQVPSEFEEGKMSYCGTRISRDRKMCTQCTEKAEEKKQ
jgi:hypothetical protein